MNSKSSDTLPENILSAKTPKNEKRTQHPMEATVSVIVQLTYKRNKKDPRMMARHQI